MGRWTVHVIDSNNMWASPVLSVLRRSMTSLLHSAWGPIPPNARELRLCRLHSSIVHLSIIDEECGYRVPQPFGSWGSFMIPVVVLISIGMLALYTVAKGGPLRSRGPVTRLRLRTMRSRRSPSLRSPAPTAVLAMLVPNTPQASILGPSPESTSVGTVGTAVPVQATPGIPIPQGDDRTPLSPGQLESTEPSAPVLSESPLVELEGLLRSLLSFCSH